MAINVNTSMPPPNSETMAGLLRRLVDDLSILFRQELALAKAEVTQAVDEAKAGVAGIAVGGAVLYAGFLTVLAALVMLLARVMPAWGAALLVGAVTVIAGYAMVQAARKKLSPTNLKPELTKESLRRDKEVLQRRTA
jgi:predicted phage tail protein